LAQHLVSKILYVQV